jgi:hypothetical protein
VAEWQPIATAPKDGLPLRLFCEGFINPDFNPGGSVEGQWCDDLGWVGAVWNPEQDCWDTNQIVPTHWQPLPLPPAGVEPSQERPELTGLARGFEAMKRAASGVSPTSHPTFCRDTPAKEG